MKTLYRAMAVLAFVLFLSSVQAEEKHVIIIKTGSYSLSEKTQAILNTGQTSIFEEDSSSEFSIEYEFRLKEDIAIGGELLVYANNYTTSGISLPGEANSLLLTLNAKKYFDVAEHVKPFVGVGFGAGAVDMTGSIIGNAGGFALQVSAGAEFPVVANYGLFVEYKLVSAEPEDDASQKVDISGSGLFAGLSIHF